MLIFIGVSNLLSMDTCTQDCYGAAQYICRWHPHTCDIQKLHVPARAVEISKLKTAGRILGGIYFISRQRISFAHPVFPALKGMEVLKVRGQAVHNE